MEAVLYQTHGRHIAIISLNRPEVYNAINDQIAQQLDALVKKTEQDKDIRVVILTSTSEKAFCAGADLNLIASGKTNELYTEDGGFAGFVFAKRRKPWIAAVNGFSLAGGTELCLACDLVVATSAAKFGLPEVKRGLIAGAGGVYRLPQMLPAKIAAEALLTGAQISAEKALQYGMINRIVPADTVLDEALKLAEEIAQNSPNAVQNCLAFVQQMAGKTEIELQKECTDLFLDIVKSADALEGSRAFVEKRPPVWNS